MLQDENCLSFVLSIFTLKHPANLVEKSLNVLCFNSKVGRIESKSR